MIFNDLIEKSSSVQVIPHPKPSDYAPWCNGNEYIEKDINLCLHQEIIDFTRWILPTKKEIHMRILTIRRISTAIKIYYPEAKVICHGSSATSTFLPDGDLDFVVFGVLNELSSTSILENINLGLNNLGIFYKSKVIEARCPIIKATEKPFGFQVDIAVGNENGILNIQRHKNYMSKYHALTPLLMVLKIFLTQNELDQPYTGGISSNTLMQMIIFIIQSIQKNYQDHLGVLLKLFFKIFGSCYNYFQIGISTINDGYLFKRKDKQFVDWKKPFALCIIDPQNYLNTLGGNSFECYKFRSCCHTAFVSMLRGKRKNEQSILQRFINIGSKRIHQMIERRKQLSKYYDSISGVDSIPFSRPILIPNHLNKKYHKESAPFKK